MSTVMILQISSTGPEETEELGRKLGSLLKGGEVLELDSDLGGGKTTFVKGLARGIGSQKKVSSPTFTISKIYESPKLSLHHFDFYRLKNPGILIDELKESLETQGVVTVVEWSGIVNNNLPTDRLSIKFLPVANSTQHREISITYPEKFSAMVRAFEQSMDGLKP